MGLSLVVLGGCADRNGLSRNDQQLQMYHDLFLQKLRQERIEIAERIPFPKSAPDGFSKTQEAHYFEGFRARIAEFMMFWELCAGLRGIPPQYYDDKYNIDEENLEAWRIGHRVASFLIGNETKKELAEAIERENGVSQACGDSPKK